MRIESYEDSEVYKEIGQFVELYKKDSSRDVYRSYINRFFMANDDLLELKVFKKTSNRALYARLVVFVNSLQAYPTKKTFLVCMNKFLKHFALKYAIKSFFLYKMNILDFKSVIEILDKYKNNSKNQYMDYLLVCTLIYSNLELPDILNLTKINLETNLKYTPKLLGKFLQYWDRHIVVEYLFSNKHNTRLKESNVYPRLKNILKDKLFLKLKNKNQTVAVKVQEEIRNKYNKINKLKKKKGFMNTLICKYKKK